MTLSMDNRAPPPSLRGVLEVGSVMEEPSSKSELVGLSESMPARRAHRAPKYLEGIVDKAESEGCKVFIGMAGVAAALPGVIASMTSRPVIGVPVGGKVPLDSLLSIVQMPPGMPVATVGVDRGDNAGALAIQILACSDSKLAEAYSNFRTEMTEKVISDDSSIQG